VDEPVAPTPARWSRPLRLLAVGLVVSLLTLLAWATLSAGQGSSFAARIAAGERPPAPPFELEVIWAKRASWPAPLGGALADRRLALAELRGYPVVVNFWASWCIPCRDEAPILNESARAHAGEVVFVGVDVQDLRSDALAFLREFDPPYASIRDTGNDAYEAYGLTGVPETFYLDAQGRAVAHSPGAVSRRTLEQGVAAITGGADQ
jgi:cytochrome c biogenesis protein CcmG/thiol:disulfide interchange protein DsbE